MSLLLSDLVGRLIAAVPPIDNSPTPDQYEQAWRDAVQDFNDRASRVKTTTLTIVAGTAAYDLPADFVKLVGLSDLVMSHPWNQEFGLSPFGRSPYAFDRGVISTEGGLIPLSANFRETFTVEGEQLVITPAPFYTEHRLLTYGAGHIDAATLAGDDRQYPALTEREATIILMQAKAYAIETRLNNTTGSVKSQTMGEISVTVTDASQDLMTLVKYWHTKYEEAVARYVGHVLRRG